MWTSSEGECQAHVNAGGGGQKTRFSCGCHKWLAPNYLISNGIHNDSFIQLCFDFPVLKAGERGSKMDLSNFDDIFDGGDAATPALKKANVAIIANKVEEARHPAFTRFKHSVPELIY